MAGHAWYPLACVQARGCLIKGTMETGLLTLPDVRQAGSNGCGTLGCYWVESWRQFLLAG